MDTDDMPSTFNTSEVLVLTDEAGGMYLIGRAFFAQAAVESSASLPDEPPLRAIGLLDPAFPIGSLGIRTVLGVPAPVMAVPGILDEGEAQPAVDLDDTYALLSRVMLDNVRVRRVDQARIRAALLSSSSPE